MIILPKDLVDLFLQEPINQNPIFYSPFDAFS
jgi:hypothetical protein